MLKIRSKHQIITEIFPNEATLIVGLSPKDEAKKRKLILNSMNTTNVGLKL